MNTETMGAENVRWDLSDLFTGIDDPALETVLSNADAKSDEFVAAYKGKLDSLSSLELREAHEGLIAITGELYRLSQYANLRFAVETDNDAIKALVARIDEALSRISNKLIFFNLELGALPEKAFALFLEGDELNDFAYKLDKLRRNARYNLSEKEEQIINLKNLNGLSAHQKLYNELATSFRFEFEIDGEIQTLSGDQLRALRQHPDADVRRRAMEMFFTRYSENSLTITHLYNSIVKDHGIETGLRGYSSPVSAMNSHNDLDDAAVQALNDVTTESYSLVQRYYSLKRQLLGLDEMTLADIYAPLPEASRSYDFATAKDLVLDAFGSFDSDFQKHASDMFAESRIDAPPIPGKRGGAFCSSSTPDLKPYVLLNYTGKVRDVATMAHELGHAIHSLYSRKQNLMNFHSILPLAETASIFSEMVLTDHFLKQETDPAVKISLISNKLEDIFASSHRQNMFSRFELQSHEKINASLQGAEELSSLYAHELNGMFGESVAQPELYRWEWSSIPHIFNVPFYVYAYNFGNLLVLGLYQKYLNEGDEFKSRYKQFLSLGSSASPGEIANTVGVDIRDPEFWRLSLAYIETLINTLEDLTSKS